MATVIDTLIVSLNLDAKAFTKSQKETVAQLKNIEQQASRTGKQLKKSGNEAAEAFGALKRDLLTIAALLVSVNGIKNFITGMVDATAAVERMSTNMNLNKKEIFEWQKAAEMAGGTAGDATAAIARANEEMGLYSRNLDPGGNLYKNRVKIQQGMTALELMRAKADAIAQRRSEYMGMGKSQTEADQAGMSIAGELGLGSLYNMVKNGGAAVQTQLDAMAPLAEEMAGLAADAEELRKQFVAIGNAFEKAGVKILEAFMPQIERLATYLGGKEFKGKLEEFIGWITSEELRDNLTKIAKASLLVADGLISLAEKISWFIGPTKVHADGADTNGYTYKDNQIDLNNPENYAGGTSWWGRLFNSQNPRYQKALADSKTHSGSIGGGPAPGESSIRNMRNHNPGNLKYTPFSVAHGAVGHDGEFAIFPDNTTGSSAMVALEQTKFNAGANTIRKIITSWLGTTGKDMAGAPDYIADVTKRTGISADQTLSPSQRGAMLKAMTAHEGWSGGGLDVVGMLGQNNASKVAATAGMGGHSVQGNNNTITTSTSIDKIIINTAATDSDGIANSIRPAITRAANSATGVNP